MAFSNSEVAEIRAKIPAQYQPSLDAAGLLPINFQSRAGSLRDPNHTLQGIENPETNNNPFFSDKAREIAGLAFDGDGAESSASFVLTGAQMAARHARDEKTEQEQRDKDKFVSDQIKAALDKRLAEIDAELAAIDTRLEAIRQRRTEIGDSLEALDELSELVATGKLDANNPAHAALLRRAGLTPEDAKRKDLGDVVKERRTALNGEDGTLETEWNDKIKRRGIISAEKEKVMAARAELENADNSQAKADAVERARTVLGARQVVEAIYLTDNVNAKVTGAKAVGESEVGTYKDSVAVMMNASVQTDDFFESSDDIELEVAEDSARPAPANISLPKP